MTNWDILMKLLNTPGSLSSLFIFCTSLMLFGAYIGWTTKFVLRHANMVSEETFDQFRGETREKFEKLVTKEDLRLALLDFQRDVVEKMVTKEACRESHEGDAQRLAEHVQLQERQAGVMKRLDRVEGVLNGVLKKTEP